MAKLQEEYRAVLQKQIISFIVKDGENTRVDYEGLEGILQLFVSERKNPGKNFLVFTPTDGNTSLQTAPGTIIRGKKILTIRTQNGENCYTFKILDKDNIRNSNVSVKMPEKFLHICEVCGRTEILSPDEAFKTGWDYPPKMGTFGEISPRTCGSCGMTDTVWWKYQTGQVSYNGLTEKQMETVIRIKGEPLSLILPEKDNKDCH